MTATAQNWAASNVPRLSAAFSFYAVLSLAPTLVLAVVVAGSIYGEGAARSQLLEQAREAVGPQASALLAELIDNAKKPGASLFATVFSLSVTFFSCSNLFIALQETVNTMWGIERRDPLVKGLILTRIGGFLAVMGFVAIVVAWLTFDAWLTVIQRFTPGARSAQAASLLGSILFLAVVLAITFHRIPPNRVQWRDVMPGAIVTALGITASKFLLSLYFAYANVSAAYGSAGALVVILLWIYYTSQIFFFGVELTHAYSHQLGSLRPALPSAADPELVSPTA